MSDTEEMNELQEVAPPELATIMENNRRREELQVGSSFTGPKGVISDYKFHMKQEKQRVEMERQDYLYKINHQRGGLSSGWLQRTLQREETENFGIQNGENQESILEIQGVMTQSQSCYETNGEQMDKDDDQELEDLLNELQEELEEKGLLPSLNRAKLDSASSHTFTQEETKKLNTFLKRKVLSSFQKKFGSLRDVSNETEFLDIIESPKHKDIMIVVHVYRSHIQTCREINILLDRYIAKRYPYTLFVKVEAHAIGAKFDDVVLPALLCYKNGKLEHTLMRIIDDIRGCSEIHSSFICDPEDFEDFLLKKKVIDEDLLFDDQC